MAVRVDDDRHRRRGQLAQVGQDLARLDVGRAGVDDHHAVGPAEDDADVLVEERVPTHEHAIADLDPASHAGIVAAASGSAAGLANRPSHLAALPRSVDSSSHAHYS